jgi:hypothetical protein
MIANYPVGIGGGKRRQIGGGRGIREDVLRSHHGGLKKSAISHSADAAMSAKLSLMCNERKIETNPFRFVHRLFR